MYTYVSSDHFYEEDELKGLKAAYKVFQEKRKTGLEPFVPERQFHCYEINDDTEGEIIFFSSELHKLNNYARTYIIKFNYEEKNFEVVLFELQWYEHTHYYTPKGYGILHELENLLYQPEKVPSKIEAWLTTIAEEELNKQG